MSQKVSYHAISKRTILEFNTELKEYTDNGYAPHCGISVAMCCTDLDGNGSEETNYSVILFKVIDEK